VNFIIFLYDVPDVFAVLNLDSNLSQKQIFVNDKRFDWQNILETKTCREFETEFVMKQFNYEKLEDYHQDCSCDSKLGEIKIPMIFLNAEDDIFSPKSSKQNISCLVYILHCQLSNCMIPLGFPFDKFNTNPNIALIITKSGGHISFAEGLFFTGCGYGCRVLSDFLDQILNPNKNENHDFT
jgi:abhydrolase domain-containing protein 1/3